MTKIKYIFNLPRILITYLLVITSFECKELIHKDCMQYMNQHGCGTESFFTALQKALISDKAARSVVAFRLSGVRKVIFTELWKPPISVEISCIDSNLGIGGVMDFT